MPFWSHSTAKKIGKVSDSYEDLDFIEENEEEEKERLFAILKKE